MGLAVWGGVRCWRGVEPGAQAPAALPDPAGGEETGPHGRSSRSGLDRVWPLALTWGPVLGFAGVCLVLVGGVSYRLPGEFPLTVCAAVGVLDLLDRRRSAAG